jgi:hypothetical protein
MRGRSRYDPGSAGDHCREICFDSLKEQIGRSDLEQVSQTISKEASAKAFYKRRLEFKSMKFCLSVGWKKRSFSWRLGGMQSAILIAKKPCGERRLLTKYNDRGSRLETRATAIPSPDL